MTRIKVLAAAFIVYCLTSIYSLYTQLSTRFGMYQSSQIPMQSFRGHIGAASWVNSVSLISIAVIFGLSVMPSPTSLPKWIKALAILSIVLVAIQIVVSHLHTGMYGAGGFHRFNPNFSNQFGGSTPYSGNS
jgi:hypothetical protein